jgi:ribosomal protein S18 acetylase RimI-like enzyme
MKALQNIGNKALGWLKSSPNLPTQNAPSVEERPGDSVTISRTESQQPPQAPPKQPEPKIEIEPSNPLQLPALQQIAENNFKETGLPEEYYFSCGPIYANENQCRLDVAKSGDSLLGYVQYTGHIEIPTAANIDVLMVVPEAQGRKVGEELLLNALEKISALGYPEVRLQIEDGNAGAEKLYQKYGFVPAKVLSAYYPHVSGQMKDGKEMSLTLDDKNRALLVQRRQQLELLKSTNYPSQRFRTASYSADSP